jgi:di/tripeptidase
MWGTWKQDMGLLHRAVAIRNIEDWVIHRIKSKLGLSEKDNISHVDVVEQFIATYRFGGVTTSDLKSVGDSEERKTANSIIHIKYPDQISSLRTAWKYVRPVLTDVEALKYERLMKFAEGGRVMHK